MLLTAVNALIAWIGPDRVNKFGEWAGREGFAYTPIRYLIWPFISVFFLTNPMAYTNGQFLPGEVQAGVLRLGSVDRAPAARHLPACQPGRVVRVARHRNRYREPRVWSSADLAVRYLLTGFIVIYIRGLVTERLTAIMWARQTEGRRLIREEGHQI